MRLSHVSCPGLAMAICLATTVAVCHAEGFPYGAHTITPNAEVYGGPGDNYAVTLELAEGTEIEVYRHDPGGWCAIRPPEGSFCLIFARHVDPLDNGLGRINKDDVPARVGSALSDVSDMVQLRLKKGELVEIFEEVNDGDESWFKIAPPAGEFRWIHASDFQLTEPVVGDADASSAEWQAEDSADPNRGFVLQTANSTESVPANSSDSAPAAPSANVSEDIALTIEAIEIQLSQMVAQDRSTWQIQPLAAAAEALLARAVTVDERAAVQQILAKINRFGTVQRQFAMQARPAFAGVAAPPTPYPTQMRAMPPSAVPTAPSVAGASPYDAVGVLRPVVSRRAGAPRYAIVDNQGEILSFITPSPDVNLQPYLGQKIAVRGTRQNAPQAQQGQATAGRVMPIQPAQRDFVR